MRNMLKQYSNSYYSFIKKKKTKIKYMIIVPNDIKIKLSARSSISDVRNSSDI